MDCILRASTLLVVATVTYVDAHSCDETTSHTQLSVLRRAQANDAEAWENLVRTYSRRIYRWCRLDGLQAADAANVVQEVFQSIALNLGSFHRDRAGDSFRAWIRCIAKNKVRDHFRREQRQLAHAAGGTDAHQRLASFPGNEEPKEFATTQNIAGRELYSAICNQVRDEFSDRDWRLFWRVVVDGQPAGEAGAEYGITANAVRLVKMRVLRRLRQLVSSSSFIPPLPGPSPAGEGPGRGV